MIMNSKTEGKITSSMLLMFACMFGNQLDCVMLDSFDKTEAENLLIDVPTVLCYVSDCFIKIRDYKYHSLALVSFFSYLLVLQSVAIATDGAINFVTAASLDTFVPDSATIASSIKYHSEFTPSFSPELFELPKAFYATAESVRDMLIINWNATYNYYEKKNVKQAYYLSMEFLQVFMNFVSFWTSRAFFF